MHSAHLDHLTQTGRARQWRQTFGPKVCINALDGVESRAAWPKHIAEDFSKVFSYTSPRYVVWRSTLRAKLVARFTSFATKPEPSICFSVDDVSSAIASLKTGKACAEDGLSAEMLKALNRECLLLLACAFSARASGDAHELMSWHLLSAVLVPKAPRISSCKKLGPITILPVLKLYSNLLLTRVTTDLVNSLSHWSMGPIGEVTKRWKLSPSYDGSRSDTPSGRRPSSSGNPTLRELSMPSATPLWRPPYRDVGSRKGTSLQS